MKQKNIKRMKQIIAWFLVVVMVFTSQNMTVLAAELSGQDVLDSEEVLQLLSSDKAVSNYDLRVSMGQNHSSVITENGDLYCWGVNGDGEVGNGTTEDQLTPIKILNNVVFSSIRKNLGFANEGGGAITESGDLYCWGFNWYGGVGNGTTENQLTPQKIMNLNTGEIYTSKPGNGNNIEHITTTSNNIEIQAYDIGDGTALGKPMKDAAVNVDKFGNARTDADGKAVIDNNLTDQPLVNTKISITKEGYREYYFYKDIYNRDAELLWENNQQTVWKRKLQEKDRSNPYISTLMCQTSYGKIYDAMNYREVYQSKGGTQNIKLQMNAVWNGKKPDSYILYQENGVSYTSTDGKFSLDMGKDFEAKYPIYAKLVAEDGTSVTEKTSFEITGNSSTAKPGNTLDLINTDSTGTLGEDIAFLSGQDFSIKMGGAKLDFSVEKGIIKATIGKNKKISEGGYGAKDWEEWKALCENEPSDLNLMSQWKDAIENIDTGWTDDLKGKTEVYGYLEGAINNSGSTMLTGKIKLKSSIDSGMQAQYMIGVIPVYIKVSYGAKGGVESALVYNWTEKKIDAEKSGVTLSLEPYLAAEGGVGVMAVAEVGVEGKGSMPFSTKLGTNDETKLSLKGTLSLKAKLLIFEYSLKLAEAELKLLPIEQPQSIAQAAGISELSMNDFKLSDSHYLEKESLWLGNSAIQPFSLETTETGAAERVLKTNIYPDADMQMVTAGDTKMILWTEGDPKRASINNSKLVYSIYNAADDTWSAPEAVADDGTADFAPSVVSDGERIYAAWQNINREFTNDAALSEVAAASTAVMSVWTAGEGFSDAVTVSEAGCMAVMPKIALNADGKPYVAYLQNTDNNLLLTTGQNHICYSVADGNDIERKSFVECSCTVKKQATENKR